MNKTLRANKPKAGIRATKQGVKRSVASREFVSSSTGTIAAKTERVTLGTLPRGEKDIHLNIGSSVAKEHAIFQVRATRAVEHLLATLDSSVLVEAASAPTDTEVLLSALQQPSVLNSLLKQDPLAEAKLRGQRLRKELLEAEGGVIGPEEVGNLLGIQRQSVDKRRKAGTLLALELGNRFVFPAWQIDGNSTVPHLEDVLAALHDQDEWRKLSFFVNGNVRLDGKSPLEVLRTGEYEGVLKAARSLGEHGALEFDTTEQAR
jgi:hypothetical protein